MKKLNLNEKIAFLQALESTIEFCEKKVEYYKENADYYKFENDDDGNIIEREFKPNNEYDYNRIQFNECISNLKAFQTVAECLNDLV